MLKLVQGGKGKRGSKRSGVKRRRRHKVTRLPRGRYRENVGAWVITPSMVADEIRTIHVKVKLLEDRLMSAKSPATEKTRGEFLAFYKEWLKFRAEHSGFWDKVGTWSGTWDKVQSYKTRTNTWVQRAAKLGVLSAREALPVAKAFPWSGIMLGLGLLLGLTILSRSTKG